MTWQAMEDKAFIYCSSIVQLSNLQITVVEKVILFKHKERC